MCPAQVNLMTHLPSRIRLDYNSIKLCDTNFYKKKPQIRAVQCSKWFWEKARLARIRNMWPLDKLKDVHIFSSKDIPVNLTSHSWTYIALLPLCRLLTRIQIFKKIREWPKSQSSCPKLFQLLPFWPNFPSWFSNRLEPSVSETLLSSKPEKNLKYYNNHEAP
jgi:hypothetical protein